MMYIIHKVVICKKSFIEFICKYYYIFIFIFVSAIPLTWFDKKLPFSYGDGGLDLVTSFRRQLSLSLYSWYDFFSTGRPLAIAQQIPYLAFKSFFEFIGVPYFLIQGLSLFTIIFISLLFMFLFIKKLFEEDEEKKLIALTASLFYVFNPVILWLFFNDMILTIYLVPFVPVVLYFIIIFVDSPDFSKIILFSLTLNFFSVAFNNMAFLVPLIIYFIIFFLFILLKNNKKSYKVFVSWIGCIIISFLINIWWIVPLLKTINLSYSESVAVYDSFQTLNYISNNIVSLSAFFRVIPMSNDPAWWIYKQLWFKYLYYSNPFFLLIGSALFIFCLIPLIKNDNKYKKETLFFSFFMLAGIFLMKGFHEPLGSVFLFIFKKLPYSGIFRNPINKSSIIFISSLSVLFGLSFKYLIYFLNNYKFKKILNYVLISLIIFLFIGVYNFTFWTGEWVKSPITIRGNTISSEVKVPLYYKYASNWFDDKETYRILSLPMSPTTYVGYNWEYGYDSSDKTSLLFDHETISNLGYSRMRSTKFLDLAQNKNLTSLITLLPYYNVKFIVIRNDIDPIHGNYGKSIEDPMAIKNNMSKYDNIKFIEKIGELYIYQIDYEYFLPRVYTADKFILSSDLNSTLEFMESSIVPPYNVVIFTQNQLTQNQTTNLQCLSIHTMYDNLTLNNSDEKCAEVIKYISYNYFVLPSNYYTDVSFRQSRFKDASSNRPDIIFQKINPTKYYVMVKNATEPFFLVFSESYNSNWKAYINVDQMQCYSTTYTHENLNVTECQKKYKFFEFRDLTRVFDKSVSEKNHFVANGYANAWYIDPEESGIGKNFTITLYFNPQSYFYGGMILSVLTFIVCIGYLLIHHIKIIYKNMVIK